MPEGPLRRACLEAARRIWAATRHGGAPVPGSGERGPAAPGIRILASDIIGALNACALGLLPAGRSPLRPLIALAPRLPVLLGPDGVMAVVAHEAAHLARGHPRLLAALATGLLLLIAAIAGPLESLSGPAEAATILALLGVWTLGFRTVSRSLELEADLAAARAAGPELYRAVFERLRCLLGSAARRGGLRHQSLEERIAHLDAALARPDAAAQAERRFRRTRRLSYGFLAIGALGAAASGPLGGARPSPDAVERVEARLEARAAALERWIDSEARGPGSQASGPAPAGRPPGPARPPSPLERALRRPQASIEAELDLVRLRLRALQAAQALRAPRPAPARPDPRAPLRTSPG